MAVAQSPISNNAPSARWYRKAVRASVMEIYSPPWEHGGRIFSASPSSCHSVSLFTSLSLSPFCLGIAFSLSKALSVQSAAPHAADWTDKALLSVLRLKRRSGSTIVAISVFVVFISVLRIYLRVCEWFASLPRRARFCVKSENAVIIILLKA